jgi:hypothetical protein
MATGSSAVAFAGPTEVLRRVLVEVQVRALDQVLVEVEQELVERGHEGVEVEVEGHRCLLSSVVRRRRLLIRRADRLVVRLPKMVGSATARGIRVDPGRRTPPYRDRRRRRGTGRGFPRHRADPVNRADAAVVPTPTAVCDGPPHPAGDRPQPRVGRIRPLSCRNRSAPVVTRRRARVARRPWACCRNVRHGLPKRETRGPRRSRAHPPCGAAVLCRGLRGAAVRDRAISPPGAPGARPG